MSERTLLRLLWPLAVLGAFALGLAEAEIARTLLRYAPIIG